MKKGTRIILTLLIVFITAFFLIPLFIQYSFFRIYPPLKTYEIYGSFSNFGKTLTYVLREDPDISLQFTDTTVVPAIYANIHYKNSSRDCLFIINYSPSKKLNPDNHIDFHLTGVVDYKNKTSGYTMKEKQVPALVQTFDSLVMARLKDLVLECP